jgi:hypothetical protein
MFDACFVCSSFWLFQQGTFLVFLFFFFRFSEMKNFENIEKNAPTFMLFLGDFIYSDHPLFLGNDRKKYQMKYRDVLADPFLRSYLTKIPTYFMCKCFAHTRTAQVS